MQPEGIDQYQEIKVVDTSISKNFYVENIFL
jgi:hypothetical protein